LSEEHEDFEEEDQEEEPPSEEYLRSTHALMHKIMVQKAELTEEEMQEVSENEDLVNAYQNRWYTVAGKESEETYFVFYNSSSSKTIKAGNQLLINYGNLSNAGLLENYGFIEENNPYDCF
jgi:hypothetical protein